MTRLLAKFAVIKTTLVAWVGCLVSVFFKVGKSSPLNVRQSSEGFS